MKSIDELLSRIDNALGCDSESHGPCEAKLHKEGNQAESLLITPATAAEKFPAEFRQLQMLLLANGATLREIK